MRRVEGYAAYVKAIVDDGKHVMSARIAWNSIGTVCFTGLPSIPFVEDPANFAKAWTYWRTYV